MSTWHEHVCVVNLGTRLKLIVQAYASNIRSEKPTVALE